MDSARRLQARRGGIEEPTAKKPMLLLPLRFPIRESRMMAAAPSAAARKISLW
jgi:hypothetical protein